jgi:hypothetical protein
MIVGFPQKGEPTTHIEDGRLAGDYWLLDILWKSTAKRNMDSYEERSLLF